MQPNAKCSQRFGAVLRDSVARGVILSSGSHAPITRCDSDQPAERGRQLSTRSQDIDRIARLESDDVHHFERRLGILLPLQSHRADDIASSGRPPLVLDRPDHIHVRLRIAPAREQ